MLTLLCCLPARTSRLHHLRIQSCLIKINLAVVWTCLSKFHRLVHCCHFHWFLSLWTSTFPLPLPLPWDLVVCLFQSAALCPYFPQFRHSPSNRECYVVVSSVTFAWVAFFFFLATLLALAGFFFAFPFPGNGIDFHWIFVVCVSGWSCLEDASAPQVILSRHAMRWSFPNSATFNWRCVFRGSGVFETMPAFFTWSWAGIGTFRLLVSSPQFLEIRSGDLPRLRSWNQTWKSWFARTVPCCQPGRTFRTSGNGCLQASKPLFPTSLTTFRAPFCVSIVSWYSKVAVCCPCGGVAITTVGDSLAVFSKARKARSSVPAYLFEVPVVKVFAKCVWLWLPDSHVCLMTVNAFQSFVPWARQADVSASQLLEQKPPPLNIPKPKYQDTTQPCKSEKL